MAALNCFRLSLEYNIGFYSTHTLSLHKSLSLEVRPGKMTALVGPSGGGKTSCVSLLKRLYEPQDGQILLDGQPLHSYQHKYLHEKVVPRFSP